MRSLTQMTLQRGSAGTAGSFRSARYSSASVHVVQTLSTSNVDIASAPATIGGLGLNQGDVAVLTGQTTASENGPWVYNGVSTAMSRPAYFAAGSTELAFAGMTFIVTSGFEAGRTWRLNSVGTLTVGTTPLSIGRATAANVGDIAGTLGVTAGGTGLNSTPTNGQLLIGNGTGFNLATLTQGTGITITNAAGQITISSSTSGGGTVTSVDLSLPGSLFTVTGNPVTSSGTLTANLQTQAANTVWSGPTTGAAATPTFRSLVAADIPNLDAGKITTGTFGTARGGTGLSAYTLGDLLYASASNTLANLAGNTTTTKRFLSQTGTGTVSAAPVWDLLSATDIPNLDTSKLTTGILPVARGGTGTADRSLVDSASVVSHDWENRFFYNLAGTQVINYNGGALNDTSGNPTVLWNARVLDGGDWSITNGLLLGSTTTATEGMLRRSATTNLLEVYHDQLWHPVLQDPSAHTEILEDWLSGSAAGLYGWTTTATGAGAAANIGTLYMGPSNPGVVELVTGTTNAGTVTLAMNPNVIQLSGGDFWYEWLLWVDQLATAAQDFVLRVGLGDTTGNTDFVDGVYFEYNRATSVNWQIKTANNSARTTGTPGTPTAVVAATPIKLAAYINPAATQAQFFINGNLYGTISTNIPTAAGRDITPTIQFSKTNGNTSRTIAADYFQAIMKFTTAR